MDLFAKAVKSGIAKGYAIGQQQLQQHLAKQKESGGENSYDNAGSYGAQHNVGGAASYASIPQQQQQYPTAYNGPPPLPPRQYQPPQPQPNYAMQSSSQNAPVVYEIPAPVSYEPQSSSRPEYSYSSIMPPPPPSYIPPASTQATYSQNTPNPPPVDSQHHNTNLATEYDWRKAERLRKYQQPSYEITAGYRPVPVPLTAEATHAQPQQTQALENTQGYLVRTSEGGFQLVQPNEQPAESLSYATPPPAVANSYQVQAQPAGAYDYRTPIEPTTETRETEKSKVETNQQKPLDVSASIEQQLSNLSLGTTPGQPETAPRSYQKPKKRIELPPIVEDGPGQEVVRFCPEHRLVDYQLYWYYLPDLPDAPICTRCHADHIQSTPLAGNFTRKLAEPDTVSSCHFRYSRVQKVIWPAALKTNSVDDLSSFLSSRLLIPNCKGRDTTGGSDGIKYFGMKDNDINGFIACEACFQDDIVGTAFEPKFGPYPHEQGKNDRWTCDVSIQYIPKALAHFASRNDWRSFVDNASRRFKLAACDGQEKARADSGNWFTTRQAMENLQICEPCFMDKLELGPFATEFTQMSGPVDFDEYIVFLRQRWTCSVAGGASLPIMFALDAAESKDDFGELVRSIEAITKLVPCTKYGIIRGKWWTVTGGCKNFDLCEACYEGIMKPNGLDKFLESKEHGPEETIICDFCPAAPRYHEYLNKFVEALDRSVFSYYAEHIRTFAAVQACPGRDTLSKARWWGYGETLFCENCYLVFVRHTSLGEHMPLQGEYDERAQICQMWSPRMRNMWRAACDAGDPGSPESEAELIKLRAFGTKRLEVYLATVPRIQFIRGMKDIKMMQAMQQGQLSLMYQGMNSMAVLSGTDDGNLHGNSSIGWYETENGATGAQMFNNMQAGMADATRGDEWMQIFQLELLWKEVE